MTLCLLGSLLAACEAPYDRRRGEAPALSDAEIDDVIAFLQTLSDNDQQP
jgi:cytochrome c peroxidase